MAVQDLAAALTALSIAIQTEKDGREFYKRAAERTNDPGGKVLFASLADDERKRNGGCLALRRVWMNTDQK
jgi:rubrerythrin